MQEAQLAAPLRPLQTDLGAALVDLDSPHGNERLLTRIAHLEVLNRQLDVLNKQLEINIKELTRLVYLDALTGLGNRRYFYSALESAIARSTQTDPHLALLLCDIDCFKHYNDAFGHGHGDTVLVRISALMQSFCGRRSDCAARYGGEEFALLLPGLDVKESVAAAERLRRGVEALQIMRPNSQTPARVTISVGVTSVHTAARYPGRALVEAADAALYRAKRAGRNRVKFEKATAVNHAA